MAKKQTKGSDDGTRGQSAEMHGSPKMGTAVISGATFTNKSVVYYDINGIAMVEGDIALGPVDLVKKATADARDAVATDPTIAFGVGITGSQFRWPNCRIPFEIDPNLPNPQRVTDAIAHWESRTSFRFPARTAADQNFVRFTDAGGCWSNVGMQGGQQTISLGAGCTAGNAIHEIGHTVGLWHEQSREDRDLFVTIHWENIQSGMAAQFNQHITDGDDLGAYDYGSIMHYPRTAFSKNGQDTITPTDPNAQIGQRTALSPVDIAAVRTMYPACGFKKPWLEPGGRFKKIKDETGHFKKLRDDVWKPRLDPKLPRDPGPVKFSFDPMPWNRPEILGRPGGLRPFTLATPHHAMEAAGAGLVGELERQLLDIEAAIAQSQATAAQASAEAARLQELGEEVAAAYADALGQGGGGGGNR